MSRPNPQRFSRRNPVAAALLTRSDTFSIMGAAIGSELGRWAATLKPSYQRFKPSAVIALRMGGICLGCSGRAALLHRPFISPQERKVYARRCPMCGRVPHV